MLYLILAGLLGGEPDAANLPPVTPKGILVAVGGGTTTVEIVDRTIELAGGPSAKVVILAEAAPDNGPGSLAMWERSNVAKATLVDAEKPAAARKAIAEADLIWMPGGLQGVFMNRLKGTGIQELVHRRYYEGAVVAGTSAGAAVMSKIMIGGRSDLDSLKAGTAPYLMDGLGLWPEAIVDQHFLQKGRFNRLALATMDYPNLIGVGIDEETAAIVRGREVEVIGENNVTVIDARRASREKLQKGEPAAARNMTVHVLRAGMKFNLND